MGSSVVKGLAAIEKYKADKAAQQEQANAPKANWFNFGKDRPDQQTVRFLQEFSEESPHYSEANGLGFMAVEHVSPENWKRRATCTLDSEGRCFACEQHKASQGDPEYKGQWKQKTNLYVNVLVDTPDGPRVEVLSRNANSSFVEQLLQELRDEDGITDANYRITKSGTGTSTTWTLKRLKGEPLDDKGVEVFPDESVLRAVEYDRQPKYYDVVVASGAPVEERKKVEVDEDW